MSKIMRQLIVMALAITMTHSSYANEMPALEKVLAEDRQVDATEEILSEDIQIEKLEEILSEDRQIEEADKIVSEDRQIEESEAIISEDRQVEEIEEIVPEDTQVEATESEKDEFIQGGIGKVILTLDSRIANVEGEKIELITPPQVIEGVTLLPLRFIGDYVLDAVTTWDPLLKTVTIMKEDKIVIVTLDSQIAVVNGEEVPLTVAPQVIQDTTLLPLRFIGETFGLTIDYDNKTKTITVHKPHNEITEPPIINQAPIASFHFAQEYTAGQPVQAINTSIDPDGDSIIDQLWCVEGERRVTNRELSNMFRTPRAGTYTIGLRVQDAKGEWSEWQFETITILPNKVPTITHLVATKSEYAQGEKIDFGYTYENEEWEDIKEGKWTYRQAYQDAASAVVGKPDRIFTEGDYIVTLYLDDAYGNRSQAMETTIHISHEQIMSELKYRFTEGKIGDWIDNFHNQNYLQYKVADVHRDEDDLGTLIMSDSPEVVPGTGILYRDYIEGKGRLLIHHINGGMGEKQNLAIVAYNPTTEPITLTLSNNVVKGPSEDILRVGQLAINEYLRGTPKEEMILLPGEKKYIYNKAWKPSGCISGHIDVETSGKIEFIIANMGALDTLAELDEMVYYPADGTHYSGTYNKIGMHYSVVLEGDEPERLTLGIANSGEWAMGYDQRTMMPVENQGNYGITYYVTITAKEDMGVILNNRGGMFRGSIKWDGEGVYDIPGTGSFSGTTSKAVVMGVIKKGETKTFEYLLPNGSATPTLIGFIPASHW